MMLRVKDLFHFLMSSDGNILRRLLRSGIWVGLSSAGFSILSFLRSIILARLLTPEIFGMMSICLVVIRGMEIFSETGFGAALIHRQKDFDDARDTAFSLLIGRGILLAGITIMIAPVVASYYDEPLLSKLIRLLSIVFILNGFHNINTVALQKELDFKRLAYFEQLVSVISFITVVVLAYFLRNVWALVLGHVVGSFVGVLLSFIIIPGKPRLRVDSTIARELFQYGKYITGLTVVVFLTTEIDNLVLGKVLGMGPLGYYVIAYTLANMPTTQISKALAKIIFPAFSKLQANLPNLRAMYLHVVRLLGFLAFPAGVGIVALAPEIIGVIYGQKWMPCVPALRVLCVFGVFRTIGAMNGYLYNAIGRPNISFYMNSVKLLVIIVLIYPLTVRFGLLGASFAVTIPLVAQFGVSIFVMARVINLRLRDVPIVMTQSFCTSVIMGVVVWFFRNTLDQVSIGNLMVLVGSGALTYMILNVRQFLYVMRKRKYLFQMD